MRTEKNHKSFYDESDWSDPEMCTNIFHKITYQKELAVQSFIKSLPTEAPGVHRVKVVPLLVSMIWGPTLVADHSFTIGEMVEQFLMGKVPGVAKMQVPVVDVRDAAIAHLNSILNENVTDERIIVVGANIWFKEFAETMNEKYKKFGYNVKCGEIKFWMLKVASWIDDTAKSILPQWDKEQVLSGKKSIQALGMSYRPIRDTIIEMCDNFIDMGIVKDKRKKK